MSYITELKTEIETDPKALGYVKTLPGRNITTVKLINKMTGGNLSDTATVAEINAALAVLNASQRETIRRDEFHRDPAQHAINQTIADLINAAGQSVARTSISTNELFEDIIADADFDTLPATEATKLSLLLNNLNEIDPADAKLAAIFTGRQATLTKLTEAQTHKVARHTEAGLKVAGNEVKVGHVAMARALI